MQFPIARHNEVWLSLVERYVRDVEVASSNLVTSTIKKAPPLWRCFLYACAWHFRSWLLPCNNASSVSPPGDRRACTPGAGRVNFRAPREYLVTSTIKKRAHFGCLFFMLVRGIFEVGCCFATTQVRFHRPEIGGLARQAQGA